MDTWPKARAAIHGFAELAELGDGCSNILSEHILLGSILSPICWKLNIMGAVLAFLGLLAPGEYLKQNL